MSEQNQRHGLGQLFRKRVIDDKRVVPALVGRYIVRPLDDLIGLTFADPFDRFQPNPREPIYDRD